MSEEGEKKPPEGAPDHAKALEAWERGELTAEEPALDPHAPAEPDEDRFLPPPRRSAFPPNVFVILALGLAVLAAEPTADLSYTLFGPSQPFELGEPGHYRLDEAHDGQYVKASGILGARYATYSRFGTDYEVRQMLGTAVLVRRPPREVALGKDVVEAWTGEGRLVRLDTAPAGFLERLLRPNSRYTTLRLQFAAYGELPAGRDAYLLLTGEKPRASLGAILTPLFLWALVLASLYGALRAVRLRRERREALERLRRLT